MPTTVIGQHYYLYMIVDNYSRKVVGWEVHHNETGEQAAELLERSVWAEKYLKTDVVAYSHEDDHSFSPKLNTCSHPC